MKKPVWQPRRVSLVIAALLGSAVVVALHSSGNCEKLSFAQTAGAAPSPADEIDEDDGFTQSLDQILTGLKSPDVTVRETAHQALQNYAAPSSEADGLRLLRAAALSYPRRKGTYDAKYHDTSSELVKVAAERFYPSYLPVIREVFAGLSERAKLRALRLLVDQAVDRQDRAALTAFVALFQAHAKAGRLPELEAWVTEPLRKQPRYPEILFPQLLSYAAQPKLAVTIFLTALYYCEAGLLTPRTLTPHAGHLINAYEPMRRWLLARQRPTGHKWMWTREYQKQRDDAAILLDVMGYCPAPAVRRALQQTLTFRDARLKHFAVIALLRQGQKVPPQPIKAVAASDEMRGWLYEQLQEMGKLTLFPRQYATQKALAQADMVQWLVFPTELGRVPDEIQLMRVVPIQSGQGKAPVDYYVFRFRVQGDADGWLAGIAGPYPRGKFLSVAGRDTFSRFEKWGARTPEGHVRARLGEKEE